MLNIKLSVKKPALLFLLLLGYADALQAQEVYKPEVSHPISAGTAMDVLPATGTIDIVAVMVEFQPDTNRFTTGNGTFDLGALPFLESRPDFRIEPLPHNRAYFEAHLEFVQNYYSRSSGGQLNINYRVLPQIYRLDQEMAAYSPTGVEFNPETIADFVSDVWAKVESEGGFDTSGLDPDRTAFVIFHAGVGRDIELTGTLLTRTPQDIPSLSFDRDALADLLDDPAFNGFPVNGGAFRITNSLILPRTESRPGEDVTGEEFVIPLSINGLLTASVGSFLGLPDLFNTNDGRPGIGRFGLMDGAGFFSYNGLFPPEPSAWEKQRLGWISPVEISRNQTTSLPAVSLHLPGSVARISLSEDEYFLVENRHRDPDDHGVNITTRKTDGSLVTQNFTNIDEAFVFQEADFDTLLEAGVIVDVSNFDWSLPGGLDRGEDEEIGGGDDRFLNGGILIWHVDEAVIRSGLQQQTVNANPDRRGIDLEEADGAQDIGRPVSSFFSNEEEFGTPFDFWWSGNDSRVILQTGEVLLYPGEFSPDSYPDNNSNSGAKSFFRLFDFSDNLPTASFSIEEVIPDDIPYRTGIEEQLPGTDFFKPDDDYYNYFPLSLHIHETATDTFLVIPTPAGTWAKNLTQESPAGLLDLNQAQQPFSDEVLVIGEKPDAGNADITVNAYRWNAGTAQFDAEWSADVAANTGFLSSDGGDTLFSDQTSEGLLLQNGSRVTTGSRSFQRSADLNGAFSLALETSYVNTFGEFTEENALSPSARRQYTGLIDAGSDFAFFGFTENRFFLMDDNGSELISEEDKASWPAITDDFEFFRINKTENTLEGRNRFGAQLDFTPISAPDGVRFTGTPLIADFLVDEPGPEILVTGQDSLNINIYGYTREGRLVSGFPLFVGSITDNNNEPVHPLFYGDELFAISHNGRLRSWLFDEGTEVIWPGIYGEHTFNKISARIESDEPADGTTFSVLNKAETYNWPNPATDQTNIRYELVQPGGEVELTIITPSGKTILTRNLLSNGGAPEEFNLNTTSWESGVYYCMVKATVEGRSESELIKIAILK